ncbi:NAD(P)H-hydrate dehydratase [Cohnella sp.]|uniref:NAD(P)H-hydrate dehydratase n=1 Tax=Cohnella sp. TaxID=1883426 RepID=UPI003562EB8C
MLFGVADDGNGEWRGTSGREITASAAGKQAVVAGPGLGRWAGDSLWLRELWSGVIAPLVLDADALNMVAETIASGEFSSWRPRKAETIVTPPRTAVRSVRSLRAISSRRCNPSHHQIYLHF